MKIVAITQARSGSTRLPNKVLMQIGGKTLLGLHLDRIAQSTLITETIVATTVATPDLVIQELAEAHRLSCYRGSEQDVLDRFYQAIKDVDCDYVVRLTSDCPLIDATVIDQVISHTVEHGLDYCSNTLDPTYPDGQDVEVMTKQALVKAWNEAKLQSEREHVTPYIWKNSTYKGGDMYKSDNYSFGTNYGHVRMTVDEQADFDLISDLILKYGDDKGWMFYTDKILTDKSLNNMNQDIVRNEGLQKSINEDSIVTGKSQELYKKAKTLIPGGTMLLSKRPEMFLPDLWPSYYSKAKGCTVWDIDGKEYLDMSIMGIGTNTLGYGHDKVDAAVQEVVAKGNMSTFNCPEEVELAERLVAMHSWSDMVRFCRTGGEANAVAIRIARAATGKDKVAICGYHGWHDWYLSTNLGTDDLSGHLLPGLDPAGVPKGLEGSVLPFNYNDLETLTQLVKDNPDLGVIKMEVSRNFGPEPGFLEGVRKLATDHGCVLIFDECTSGFRETYGGLHKKYGVEPDMAMFGKTMGNGYAITGVVGKRSVMEAAQKTFISSTFWTERIGPTAALAAMDVMKDINSWDIITTKGAKVKQGWSQLADSHGLTINISGLDSLAVYGMISPDWLKYKTYITQELLKKGILGGNLVYSCIAHSQADHDRYFEGLDPIFATIKKCEDGAENIENLLQGEVCHGGFKRLN